ncbi:MAG: 50S ribosomal protein L21 [Phycisphaeraceae bacterium]|nr:MAG: 50S ribosomal protein L21 [Phycisphaeraceae bacterium]
MYAIIEDSGTQIRAAEGDLLTVDIRELPDNAKSVTFDKVLLIGSDKSPQIGTPYVAGATVTADIVEREFLDKKIDVIKYKRRKGYKRKQGHRQRLMKVKVTKISA